MKKLLAILLALVMVLSMAACGGSGSGEPDPNLGKYDAVSAEMSGLSLNVKSVFKDGFSIELKDGGKATFHYDGKDYSMKWTLEGDTFNAKGGGAELSGTLADGKMVLENVLDSGISITLIDPEHKSDEPEAPVKPTPTPGCTRR